MSTLFQAKAKLSWSGADALAPVQSGRKKGGREKQWLAMPRRVSHAKKRLLHGSLFPKGKLRSCVTPLIFWGRILLCHGAFLCTVEKCHYFIHSFIHHLSVYLFKTGSQYVDQPGLKLMDIPSLAS